MLNERKPAIRALLVAAMLSLPAKGMVPGDSVMPMEVHNLSGSHVLSVPKGVDVLRGVWVRDRHSNAPEPADHNAAVCCHLWDFCYLEIAESAGGSAAGLQSVLNNAAGAGGHGEIKNLPFVWDSPRGTNTDIISALRDRCIAAAHFEAGGIGAAPNALTVGHQYECRAEGAIASLANKTRGESVPNAYVPVWGWTRGTFTAIDYYLQVFDYAIATRLPSGAHPADGNVSLKNVSITDGWLGDQSTWYGAWPMVYRYNDFPKAKTKGSWIPNAYLARVWKATVAKDPELTNQDNTLLGIMHRSSVGAGSASTFGCSSPPQIGVISPIGIHNKSRWNPIMVPRDTTISLDIRTSLDNVEEIDVYEGDRLVTTKPRSPYKIWKVPCQLGTPGVRCVIVHAKLQDGSRVTSRPAVVFVDHKAVDPTVAAADRTRALRPHGLSASSRLTMGVWGRSAIVLRASAGTGAGARAAYSIRGRHMGPAGRHR